MTANRWTDSYISSNVLRVQLVAVSSSDDIKAPDSEKAGITLDIELVARKQQISPSVMLLLLRSLAPASSFEASRPPLQCAQFQGKGFFVTANSGAARQGPSWRPCLQLGGFEGRRSNCSRTSNYQRRLAIGVTGLS